MTTTREKEGLKRDSRSVSRPHTHRKEAMA